MSEKLTMGDLCGDEGALIVNYKELQKAKKNITLHSATQKGIPVFDGDMGIIVYDTD